MSFLLSTTGVEFAGKTLVIPIVSSANVAQLAADLLIATFSLRRLAIFDPSFFIPVVGGRDDGEDGITTPYEIYGKDNLDLLVIQQRSPVLKSRKDEFISILLGFLKISNVASVLFLSGVDLSNRTDSQMFTPTYQFHPPNSPALASSPLHSLASLSIPTYISPDSQNPQSGFDQAAVPFIPGGGLTRRILSSLPKDWITPTASLLQFVIEGDNRADATTLAGAVTKVLGLDHSISEWQQPSSWNQGLFGAPHDQTLYG